MVSLEEEEEERMEGEKEPRGDDPWVKGERGFLD